MPSASFSGEESTITSSRADDVVTIVVVGEIDLANAHELDAELQQAEATDAKSIVLDLAAMTFMDSTGASTVFFASMRSSADSNRLRITRPPGAVMRTLEVAGLADALPFSSE